MFLRSTTSWFIMVCWQLLFGRDSDDAQMRRRVRKTENQNDEALARVRFRPCLVKDVAEVIRFWNKFAAAHNLKDEPAAVRRRLKRDRRLFVLAWDDGRLVGT